MASAIYPKYKEALLTANGVTELDGASPVKIALIDTGAPYVYSATHEFLSDLAGRVGTDQTLGTKTFTDGAFDSADPTWTGLSGNTVEAAVIYIDTGTPTTSRLVAYLDGDSLATLPLSPNSGDVTINVDAAGWFQL